MADTKLSAITENVSPALEDLIYTVDDPSGTPVEKRVTLANLFSLFMVDRGDPSDWDFDEGDLTTDDTWRDLDLSSIVPAGARFVIIGGYIVDDAVGSAILFRENGNSNEYNRGGMSTQVINTGKGLNITVACDSSRIIEYKASNVTFTGIKIVVRGWTF